MGTAYFLAAKLGLSMAVEAEQVTLVWPAAGIALASLILFGGRVWPGVALGAFLANVTAEEPVLTALGIATGNTLEAVAGAFLLRRLVGFHAALDRVRDALGLVVLAAGLAPCVSATVGVLSLCLGGVQPWQAFSSLWWTWWLGDAIGILVVVPVLTAWKGSSLLPWWPYLEGTVLMVALGTTCTALFSDRLEVPILEHEQAYLVFPFLIWAGMRLDQRGTSLAILIVSAVAITGSVAGGGPFGDLPVHQRLVLVQVFVGTMATTALLLGAAVSERRRSETSLAMQYTTARAVAGAKSADAVLGVLGTLSRNLSWDFGALWSVDRKAGLLRCVDVYRSHPSRLRAFEQVTRSSTFQEGEGLPGRVWATGAPAWIPDVTRDTNFPRGPVAIGDGLHAAFAIPLLVQGRTVGVMEFFSREIGRPDQDLLDLMSSVGTQIGQFLERRDAEAQALASEALRRSILESALDCIVGMDHEGKVTEFNPAAEKTFGYAQQETTGRPLADLIIPATLRERHRLGLERYLATGATVVMGKRVEMTAMRRDGTEFPVELTIVRIPDREPPLFTGFLRDITEAKRREREIERTHTELRRSNAELESFAYVASHDLQEPLRTVIAFTQLLESRIGGSLDDEAREAIEYVVGGAKRMNGLVQDLLTYSRVGRLRRVVPTPAGEALREALVNLDRAIGETGAVVSYDELPTVAADPRELVQLFQNLVGNAIKFSGGTGPEVRIAARAQGREWIFRVTDNGIGISPDYLEKIFVLFQRLNPREYAGTGLGLAICKKIVEAQGGRIWVESAPRRGSTFYFTLPGAGLERSAAAAAALDTLDEA